MREREREITKREIHRSSDHVANKMPKAVRSKTKKKTANQSCTFLRFVLIFFFCEADRFVGRRPRRHVPPLLIGKTTRFLFGLFVCWLVGWLVCLFVCLFSSLLTKRKQTSRKRRRSESKKETGNTETKVSSAFGKKKLGKTR